MVVISMCFSVNCLFLLSGGQGFLESVKNKVKSTTELRKEKMFRLDN